MNKADLKLCPNPCFGAECGPVLRIDFCITTLPMPRTESYNSGKARGWLLGRGVTKPEPEQVSPGEISWSGGGSDRPGPGHL